MATLPNLYANGTVSNNWSVSTGAATAHEAVAADDTTHISATGSASATFDLDPPPNDFVDMDTLSIYRVAETLASSDRVVVKALVLSSDEATAYTDTLTIFDNQSNDAALTSLTATLAFTLTAAGLSATKTDWDGARIRITAEWTMGLLEGYSVKVDQIYLTGTYSQPVATTTYRPTSTITAGGWTTTEATLHGAISDQVDTTIITGTGA